jgi:hypothetical protein
MAVEESIKIRIQANAEEFKIVSAAVEKALADIGKQADVTAGKVKSAGNAVKSSNMQWTNLALVIQDLPYGFRAIQNNLPALAGSMAAVTGPAYLAFSGLIAILTVLDQELGKVNKSAKELSDKTGQANIEMAQMGAIFSAVKQGTLDARDATRMYNEKLGDLFGTAKNVYEAEKLYVSKTEGYIKAQYFRAKADLEYEKAKEALGRKDKAYAEDQVGILGKLGLAVGAFFKSGLTSGVSAFYEQGKIYAKDYANMQIELAGYVTDKEEAEFNKRVALGDRYKNQEFEILKAYGIKATTFQDDLDKEAERKRKEKLAAFKKSQKELEDALKAAAIRRAKAGGNIEVIKEPELDPKAQAKAFAAKMAFDKKMSKARVNTLKEQYQLEVSEAEGSFEKIKVAEETMRAALNQGFMDGSIKLSEYLDAILELRKKSNKTVTDESKAATQEMMKMGVGIMSALGPALDMLLDKGAALGDVLRSAFQSIIKQLIKVAIAAAVAVALLSIIFPEKVAKAGGALKMFGNLTAGGMGLGAQLFANGGIISGPTLGLMGEYPGAAHNPEVVAPLDKLQSMMGGGGGTLEARISGNDLLILMNKASRTNNNTF